MYHYGEGVSQDIVKAREWYLKAVNSGNTDSQTALDAISKDRLDAPPAYSAEVKASSAYLEEVEATLNRINLQPE
ncbi:hypothetical protein BGZ76_006811, partial [Entomortierella beljakovae]